MAVGMRLNRTFIFVFDYLLILFDHGLRTLQTKNVIF